MHLTWLETLKTGFLTSTLICCCFVYLQYDNSGGDKSEGETGYHNEEGEEDGEEEEYMDTDDDLDEEEVTLIYS